jgi:hypothetical protein
MTRLAVICAAAVSLAVGLAGCGPSSSDEPDHAELEKLTREWMTAVAGRDGAAVCATYVHGAEGLADCVATIGKRLAASPLADLPPAAMRAGKLSLMSGGSCCIATAVISTVKPDFRRTVLLLDSENPGNSFLVAQDPLCGPRECGRAR